MVLQLVFQRLLLLQKSVKYFTGDKYAENNKFEKYMLNGSEE